MTSQVKNQEVDGDCHFLNIFRQCRKGFNFKLMILSLAWVISCICDPGGERRKTVKHLEQIPGPRAYPLVGNALGMIFPAEEIFYWLENVSSKWGPIARYWVFGSPKVFINSYDLGMQLLSRKNFLLKSVEFEALEPVGKYSLPGASPHMHPIKRKLLGPGYSRQKVEESVEIFTKHILSLEKNLKDVVDKNVQFDVLKYIGMCSYMIGCETAFGPEIMLGLTESDYKQQIGAWHMMLINLVRRSLQPWFKWNWVYNCTPMGAEVNRCFRLINNFAENAIKQRKAHNLLKLKENCESGENASFQLNSSKHENFLDLLLELEEKKEITKDDVVHELNIFIVAGYDTTGTTAGWTLHLLASYPEHQIKIVDELREIFGANCSPANMKITVADTKRMKYLEYCIKEAMRLYPVLPWLLRRTNEEVTLTNGLTLPANVDVPINTFIMHRDPEYFPNPTKFLPSRHAGDTPTKSFLPFGAGPRICPGMLFGMLELKIMLARLILAYSWESVDDPDKMRCVFQGVLMPENGINVKITSR